MLIHPSSGACDLFVELFHGLYCSGSVCVGVTVWFGWGGVVSGYHNVTPTHIEPEQYNPMWFGWGGVVPGRRLKYCFSLHTDTTPHHPSQTTP